MSRYVMYQGKRLRVLAEEHGVGDEVLLGLQVPGSNHLSWAHARDCRAAKQQKRRFKDGRHVLEYTSDGQLSIRRARSPKRYPLELADIYNFAVRCAVLKGTRLPKAFRARRSKR